MGRKNFRKNFIKERVDHVEIMDISEDGRGIGKKDGEVFFVKGAVPGEVLTIEVISKKKSVKEARILDYELRSDLRVEPFCDHFGECGGCKWQHLSYPGQLFYKEKQVRDALERIAKIDKTFLEGVWHPILPSQETQYYRNKLEYTFSHRRWKSSKEMQSAFSDTLENSEERMEEEERKDSEPMNFSPGLGFHFPGSFDRILDIEHCYLQKEPSNSLRNRLKSFCIEQDIPFFNLRTQEGFMRNILIRTSSSGETMIVVIFAYLDSLMIKKVMDFINDSFPEIHSLQYIINSKKNDTLFDQEVILYKGLDFIRETMGPLNFRISAKSFYQTNSHQAEKLYALALSMANVSGNELVFDLYTGTGTIANYIASKVKRVIGLEYVEDAIQDAKKNSEYNGIFNTEFYTGDIKDLLSDEFIQEKGSPQLIITDPPRAGMHPDVIQSLLNIKAPKLVYISCNPATQARDLIELCREYDLVSVQPVDMFPQTQHVENIVLLHLK